MRVASLVHFYLPYRRAGSETMLHTLNKALLEAGHEVMATATMMPDAPRTYEYEGIPVVSSNWFVCWQSVKLFQPDIVLTHHDNALRTVRVSRMGHFKSVFLVHNSFDVNRKVLRTRPDLTIFNSNWIRKHMGYEGPSEILHPPVWATEHSTTRGNKVTLVNLNENKGGKIFYRLAELLPEIEFLGVIGGHGDQIVRHDLPNVEIQGQTSNMKEDVWAKTKVLLMPSIYESYGMVGVEAMASGIPVVAHPTQGLKESLGAAGIFADRGNLEAYREHVDKLMNDDLAYAFASEMATSRSFDLNPSGDLNRIVHHLEILGG